MSALASYLKSEAARRTIRYVTVAGVVVVLSTDALTPAGFNHSILYFPLVLLALGTRQPAFIRAIAIASILCIIVGGFLSPAPADLDELRTLIANRLISVMVMLIVLALALAMLDLDSRLQGNQADLARARDDLASKQDLLRVAGELGSIGGWSVNLAQQRVTWSEEVARIHGVDPGFVPTLAAGLAFYAPEHRSRIRACLDACVASGRSFDDEFELIRADGRRIWVRIVGEAVRDDAGRIVEVHGAFQDVSLLRRVRDADSQALRRLRDLAEAMPLIVWTAEASGRMDYVNPAIAQYSGLSERALIEGTWVTLVPKPARRGVLRAWARARRDAQMFSIELPLRRRDGEYRWHLLRGVPTRDGSGRIAKWHGSATDIHDHKQLARQATELARRLTSTIESITDAFVTIDREWRYTFVNAEAARFMRRDRDALLGANVWEEFPEIVGTLFYTEMHRARNENRTVAFEEYYAPYDKWSSVHVYPSEEGLFVHFRDVTDRHREEAQLRLLRSAIDRVNEVVLITEAEPIDEPGPRIVYVNDAFERLTGYRRDEAIGRSPRFLQGPSTRRSELDRIRVALARCQPVLAELSNRTKSGAEIVFELDIVPIVDRAGRHTHFVSVQRDVHERLALEAQLRRAQHLDSVGQLTGGVAHDFNNLLTVIMGNAEVLVEALSGDEKRRELAAMILGASQRGAELTQRLLAFARKQMLDPKAVDANRLVAGMEGLLRRTLGAQLEMEYVRGGGLWATLVDPGQLENALLNLCLNARDAMPDGGRLTIETANVRLDEEYCARQVDLRPGQYVMVTVSDTGVGIASENLGRVFEPFFTRGFTE